MNTLLEVLVDREITQVEQMAKSLRFVTDEIFKPADGPSWGGLPSKPLAIPAVDSEEATMLEREVALRTLYRKRNALNAELADVNERITILQDPNYSRFPAVE